MAQNSHTDLVFWLTAGDCRFPAKRGRRQEGAGSDAFPLIRPARALRRDGLLRRRED
jgi:hypothetical protein